MILLLLMINQLYSAEYLASLYSPYFDRDVVWWGILIKEYACFNQFLLLTYWLIVEFSLAWFGQQDKICHDFRNKICIVKTRGCGVAKMLWAPKKCARKLKKESIIIMQAGCHKWYFVFQTSWPEFAWPFLALICALNKTSEPITKRSEQISDTSQ